jgi:glycosyltransferase involved in cell wall biosynthesis
MPRVLHVIDSLDTGGTERQLALTLLNSSGARFKHVVCALGDGEALAGTLQRAGIPMYALGRRPRHEPVQTFRQLLAVIRTLQPNLIHASLYYAAVMSRLAGRITSLPVITHLVNTTYEGEWRRDNPRLTAMKVALVQGLDGVTARHFGAWFVAVTEAVRASAIRQLGIPPDRVSVIPRGLQLDHMVAPPPDQVAALRRRLGWTEAYPVILSVGRLVPQKGHRYAIGAMTGVAQRFPETVLAVAGAGYLRNELEQVAQRAGQARRVQFLGERQDIHALLAAADLFVFPSLFEGFGGALVEAMAMGKPCVAARFAGVEEITDGGRTSRLVPAAAPDDLAAAIVQLAEDRAAAKELGAEAEAWARSRFDIRRTAAALERLYAHLLSGHVASEPRDVETPNPGPGNLRPTSHDG